MITAAIFIGLFASVTGLAAFFMAVVGIGNFALLPLFLTGDTVVLSDIAPAISERPERQEFVSVRVA